MATGSTSWAEPTCRLVSEAFKDSLLNYFPILSFFSFQEIKWKIYIISISWLLLRKEQGTTLSRLEAILYVSNGIVISLCWPFHSKDKTRTAQEAGMFAAWTMGGLQFSDPWLKIWAAGIQKKTYFETWALRVAQMYDKGTDLLLDWSDCLHSSSPGTHLSSLFLFSDLYLKPQIIQKEAL